MQMVNETSPSTNHTSVRNTEFARPQQTRRLLSDFGIDESVSFFLRSQEFLPEMVEILLQEENMHEQKNVGQGQYFG